MRSPSRWIVSCLVASVAAVAPPAQLVPINFNGGIYWSMYQPDFAPAFSALTATGLHVSACDVWGPYEYEVGGNNFPGTITTVWRSSKSYPWLLYPFCSGGFYDAPSATVPDEVMGSAPVS